MMPIRLFVILATLVLCSPAWSATAADAATLVYEPGRDLVVQVKPSLERTNHWRRAVIFAGCKDIAAQTDADPNDLYTEIKGNVLYLMLKKPEFTTYIFVQGDNGVQYPLFVYGADANEDLPGQIVISTQRASTAKPSDNLPESLDSQCIRLTKHLYGHKIQPGVSEAADLDREQLAKGVRQIGRRIYETDSLQIKSVRVYRMKEVTAYMCVVSNTGDTEVATLPFQEIVVPNQLFYLPRRYDVVDAQYPGMLIKRHEPRVLYIFTREGGK